MVRTLAKLVFLTALVIAGAAGLYYQQRDTTTTKLNEALRGALKDPELIERQEALGITVVSDVRVEPAAHRKFVEGEVARWAKVIQAAGAYAD